MDIETFKREQGNRISSAEAWKDCYWRALSVAEENSKIQINTPVGSSGESQSTIGSILTGAFESLLVDSLKSEPGTIQDESANILAEQVWIWAKVQAKTTPADDTWFMIESVAFFALEALDFQYFPHL